LDPQRAAWNRQQHRLQEALAHPEKHPDWLQLFLDQHAQVHSSSISYPCTSSFEDEVLADVNEAGMRSIPPKMDHSIAWILWHLARCEDVTMNMLVAGTDQVFTQQDWKAKLNVPFVHTGNELDVQEIIRFNQAVDLEYLLEYRIAVGISTQRVVSQLTSMQLGQKVAPDRIRLVRQSGAVTSAADGIVNYWSKRTIAGLLLMPPTRHCFLHLNEATRVKKSLQSIYKPKNNI
jgi:hypothetical protein